MRREAAAIVAEEVARLAAKFREPIVLCVFEGHTYAEAATRLGWPVGTVASRLARAKDILRDRFVRRGVALPAAGLAAVFAPTASAALVRSTFATVTGPAAGVPPAVLSLTNGALFAMRFAQLKMLAAAAVALGLTAALAAHSGAGRTPPVTPPPAEKAGNDAEAKELKALQGKWRVLTTETAGGHVPAHLLAMQQLIFEGSVCTFKSSGEVKETIYVDDDHKASVRLAPGKSPKEMDATPLDGPQKGTARPSIYKLDGDTLAVCSSFGGDGPEVARPKELKAAKGVVLSVLERVKDEKDELKALTGAWKGVSGSVSGKALTAEEVAKEKWVIKGAELTLAVGNSEEKAELKLDPAALPPTFDFTITEGKEKGHVLRGIFFRQGDKLTVAIRDPKTKKNDRPTELKPGDGVIFEVLERRK